MPKRDPDHMNAQRERIILAAIACIARKGVEGSSMADIWKEAGLSAGALYVHFKNKDDLIGQCLRFQLAPEQEPPTSWAALKARMLDFNPKLGLDATTVTRARINLRAGCMGPGQLHETMKRLLDEQIADLAGWIDGIARGGTIALHMSPHQTAKAICAHVDGMLWFALARDQTLDDALPEISAGLDRFVTLD